MEAIIYEGRHDVRIERAVKAALGERTRGALSWRELKDGSALLVLNTQPQFSGEVTTDYAVQSIILACSAAFDAVA